MRKSRFSWGKTVSRQRELRQKVVLKKQLGGAVPPARPSIFGNSRGFLNPLGPGEARVHLAQVFAPQEWVRVRGDVKKMETALSNKFFRRIKILDFEGPFIKYE